MNFLRAHSRATGFRRWIGFLPLALPATLTWAAPENDNFASRRAFPSGITETGSTEGATVEPGESTHGLTGALASLWWTWTAPATGDWLLLGATPSHQIAVEVFAGNQLEKLIPVPAIPIEFAYGQRALKFEARLRTAYQIAIAAPVEKPINFEIEIVPALPNDRFAKATILTGSNFVVLATNTWATVEPGEPRPLVQGSLWWRWLAPQDGILLVETKSQFDVFRRAPNLPLEVASLERVAPCYTNRIFAVDRGTIYYLRAGSAASQFPGAVNFNLSFQPQEHLSGDWFPADVRPVSASARRWFTQSQIVHDGANSAQSNGSSEFGFEVMGPGLLSFWWKVSSNPTNSFLQFISNNRDIGPFSSNPVSLSGITPTALTYPAAISGNVDWHQLEFRLGPGTHGLIWKYAKHLANPQGLDAGWVDQIRFLPDPILPFKLSIVQGQFGNRQLRGGFVGSRYFYLEQSTDLKTWTELQTFVSQPGNRVLAEVPDTFEPEFFRLVTP